MHDLDDGKGKLMAESWDGLYIAQRGGVLGWGATGVYTYREILST